MKDGTFRVAFVLQREPQKHNIEALAAGYAQSSRILV